MKLESIPLKQARRRARSALAADIKTKQELKIAAIVMQGPLLLPQVLARARAASLVRMPKLAQVTATSAMAERGAMHQRANVLIA